MLQIDVVYFSRIPLVVLKDGPVHFSVNIKKVCFPVRTQTEV